jgi:hypothetical protein
MGNFNIYPNDDKPCWTTSIQQSGQTNDPLTWHDLGENFGKTTQILHNGQGVLFPGQLFVDKLKHICSSHVASL